MGTLFVVDIGNTQMKWGRCDDRRVVEAVALPLEDPAAWEWQLNHWCRESPRIWAGTSVNPKRAEKWVAWLRTHGEKVRCLESYEQLPLRVAVEHPERVGMDRLLNAVAASSRHPSEAAILVDAGSAVTVDWLEPGGIFCGGAIFAGVRLMARALASHTAMLPLVEVTQPLPAMPAPTTSAAIAVGVHGAVVGGIQYLIRRLEAARSSAPRIYLTGGDAALLAPALDVPVNVWPFMTLEGIRVAAARMGIDRLTLPV